MVRIGNKENIVFVPNLLTVDECKSMTEYCKSVESWTSNSYDGSNDKIHAIPSFLNPSLNALRVAVNLLSEMIEDKFGRELVKHQTPGFRKWDIGDYQPLHADGENLEGVPNEAFQVDYASVTYINDDYDGGEIEFPLQELVWKPVAGTAIFFPANRWFQHSVHSITSGVRFTSPQFWMPVKHIMLRDFYARKK